jgi:hypothetical protein
MDKKTNFFGLIVVMLFLLAGCAGYTGYNGHVNYYTPPNTFGYSSYWYHDYGYNNYGYAGQIRFH